jgi:hypothetical protein
VNSPAILDLLDQRQHVAEPQDPRGHAVRMERLEVLGLLADPDELDRLAGRGHHRQRRAAPGVAVRLGQDDARQAERAGEARRRADRVLPGHRVGDEERLLRLDRGRHRRDLAHQVLVDVETARGVDDDGVPAGLPRLPQTLARDLDRVPAPAGLVDGNADLPAERDELLDRGGPREVRRHDQGVAAAALQVERELRGRSRLPRALEPGEQDDRGFLLERQRGGGAAEEADELVAHDAGDFLRGRELLRDLGADRLLLDARREVAHDRKGHVRLQEGEADLAEGGVQVEVGEVPLAAQLLEDSRQPVPEALEHA